MSAPSFETLDDVEYGRGRADRRGIRRVIAENPSKFTYRGTGTYIVGHGDVLVVDPGRCSTRTATRSPRRWPASVCGAILVTHCHSDHSPLAAWLRAETGAPTFAFGPHGPVDDPMTTGGRRRRDRRRRQDRRVDRRRLRPRRGGGGRRGGRRGPGWTMTAVHTPGHTSNHTCYALAEQSVLFTGDHVMGWSTTVVSPPDGDMAAYIESLRKVAGRRDAMLVPTHGSPRRRRSASTSTALVEHRLERERRWSTPCGAVSTRSRRSWPCCTPTSGRAAQAGRPERAGPPRQARRRRAGRRREWATAPADQQVRAELIRVCFAPIIGGYAPGDR